MTTALDEAPTETTANPPARAAGQGWSFAVPVSACTWDGFREWVHSADFPQQGKFAFLGDRVFIDMSPEAFDTHNRIKTVLVHGLYSVVLSGTDGYLYSDGMLLSHRAAQVSNEPDLMYVSFPTLDSGRAVERRNAAGRVVEIVGTPDVAVEVVSDSSVAKDIRQLRTRYHAAGIPEYWLIDARDDDTFTFDLLRWTEAGYQPAHTADGWRPSAVFAREFRLDRGRDRRGEWSYTLQTRPLGGS